MARKYAVLIGNLSYSDSKFRRLNKPDADANALAGVLRDPSIGAFDDVRVVIDKDSAEVRREIVGLFANKEFEDLVLLYFAGHAVKDEFAQLHLAVADTESAYIAANGIDADFIKKVMDRSRSRKQVLVLDCCFSGAFSGTRSSAAAVGTENAFASGSGRVVLTATDSFQYAWENEEAISEQNSLFTHYLVEGLRSGKADLNGDGVVTADEWYTYVFRNVVASSPRQTPQRSLQAAEGAFAIANNPFAMQALPDEVTALVRSSLPQARETGVRELKRLMRSANIRLVHSAVAALSELKEDDDDRVADLARRVLDRSDSPAPKFELGMPSPPQSENPRRFDPATPVPSSVDEPASGFHAAMNLIRIGVSVVATLVGVGLLYLAYISISVPFQRPDSNPLRSALLFMFGIAAVAIVVEIGRLLWEGLSSKGLRLGRIIAVCMIGIAFMITVLTTAREFYRWEIPATSATDTTGTDTSATGTTGTMTTDTSVTTGTIATDTVTTLDTMATDTTATTTTSMRPPRKH